MTIHHLNCATLCPITGPMVCHVLLCELGDQLVLVDTGLGTQEVEHPWRTMGTSTLALRPACRMEETALQQVKTLGFDPKDVRHILLTHMDFDHAGALPDFPWATVHVMENEKNAAMHPKGIMEKKRYAKHQFKDSVFHVYSKTQAEPWKNLTAIRTLNDEISLIPFEGHSAGHALVAVQGQGSKTLVHAGDAYFDQGIFQSGQPWGLKVFEQALAWDRSKLEQNHAMLKQLHQDSTIELFCAHDEAEYRSISEQRRK